LEIRENRCGVRRAMGHVAALSKVPTGTRAAAGARRSRGKRDRGTRAERPRGVPVRRARRARVPSRATRSWVHSGGLFGRRSVEKPREIKRCRKARDRVPRVRGCAHLRRLGGHHGSLGSHRV
jgi:hypothetical protein